MEQHRPALSCLTRLVKKEKKKKKEKKQKNFSPPLTSLFLHQILNSQNTAKTKTYSSIFSRIAIIKRKHLLKVHFFISTQTLSPNYPLAPPTPSSQSSPPHPSLRQSLDSNPKEM
jgi:hypothetical protein